MVQRVQVKAPARLHLGFLDLSGDLGRRFGSIGLAISDYATHVEAFFSPSPHHVPDDIQRTVPRIVDAFHQAYADTISAPQAVTIRIDNTIPRHAGLGSGTQLALAIGTALARLYNIDASTADIAAKLDRGARSGIGIAAFEHGGFIVDGGLGEASPYPPVLAHCPFPQDWRIVLILEQHQQGVHGDVENNAFHTLPTFPTDDAKTICHLTLMQLLPALKEQNLARFGQAITSIQALIGDHFAPAQGGRYSSPVVAKLLQHAKQRGHDGIAQSSWGPTGCVFVDNQNTAEQLIADLQQQLPHYTDNPQRYLFCVTQARDHGANVEFIHQK